MNHPPPPPQSLHDDSDNNGDGDSDSDSDSDSDNPWEEDDASTSDNNDNETDSLHEGCADESFQEEEMAVNSWLARFPGRLYPRLFHVEHHGRGVVSPTRYPDRKSLLLLPPEIRNRIYTHYFDRDGEGMRPCERYAPFHNRDGIAMRRIVLGSENVELKFWLSTALLQTSRQLRYEAISILFGNRAITVEWLPALPRLLKFLGKQGCALVRYLDIYDSFDVKGYDVAGYRKVITKIAQLPGLLHLRIVVTWGWQHLSNPSFSWLDPSEWEDGAPKEAATPKMRAENIDLHWPEYNVLKSLKAEKFTLAAIGFPGERYLEFDRGYGTLPDVLKSIQSHSAMQSASSTMAATPSTSSGIHGSPENLEVCPESVLTPTLESGDKYPNRLAWQDTDHLTNKTIPLYNFFREFFHHHPPGAQLRLAYSNPAFHHFITFPTAARSTGAIIRDCAFCYISDRHCEYHTIPDQPPYDPRVSEGREVLEGDEDEGGNEQPQVEKNVNKLQGKFQEMSYVDMRNTCQKLVDWMDTHGRYGDLDYHETFDFSRVAAVLDYQGWPDTPHNDRLVQLDLAVDAGWIGKRVDKEEIPPWDILYREIRSQYEGRL